MRIENRRETKVVLTIEDLEDGDVFCFTDEPTNFYMKGYDGLHNMCAIDLQRGFAVDVEQEELEYRPVEKVNAVLTIE